MAPTARTRFARENASRFPVQVRIAVPEGGLITCGPDLYPWLDRHCNGRSGWAFIPSYNVTRPVESVVLCVADISVAADFLEAFDLETVELSNDAPFPERETLLHLHGLVGGNRTRKANL